jgi:hypothetical protein
MAEKESSGKVGRIGGWFKALFSACFGLISGAAIMYLSPLVDRVIKPAKPLANFAIELQGTQITFQNRSTGGSEGWWDFGDGSPLEPYSSNQPTITHNYPRPGVYTAKLSLHNLLNEESDRTVNVQIDGASTGPPSIDLLQATSTRNDNFAPATFRVQGKVKNADMCIWYGDSEIPTEVLARPGTDLERVFTFTQPGKHVIKLAAVQGSRLIDQTQTVEVKGPRSGIAMAMLSISRQAYRVEKEEFSRNVQIFFPEKHSANTYSFTQDIQAKQGWQIAAAKLGQAFKDPAVKDAKVTISQDRGKVILTGQLVKPAGGIFKRAPATRSGVVEVVITEQRGTVPHARPPETVAMPLNLSGPTVLKIPAMPGGWVQQQRQITLEVTEGGPLPLLKNAPLPVNTGVMLQNRQYQLTAREAGDEVQIELHELGPRAGVNGR